MSDCPHEHAEIRTAEEYETRRFEDPVTKRIVNDRVLVSFQAVMECPDCGQTIPMRVVSHQKAKDVLAANNANERESKS